jgi:putative ABC transport system ATP-binding protein
MLRLNNIVKRYRDGSKTVTIFQDLTAGLDAGQFTCVIGPSGAGKSTLLRVVNKLEPIDAGSMSLFGKRDRDYSVQQWRALIGLVFQKPVMLEGTVLDNVSAGPRLHHRPFKEEECLQLMHEVGLSEELLHKDAKTLSGGEQQRVSLIRALALKPKLLLLDEVTAALDDHHKRVVEACVKKRNRDDGLAVLWVTHDMEQMRRLAERVWFVSRKRLLQYDTQEALFHDDKTREVQAFLRYQTNAGGRR